MDFKSLLLSFGGRINRQPFWIGFIVLWIVQMIAYFILLMIFRRKHAGNGSQPASRPGRGCCSPGHVGHDDTALSSWAFCSSGQASPSTPSAGMTGTSLAGGH